jgi:hypothetical protein
MQKFFFRPLCGRSVCGGILSKSYYSSYMQGSTAIAVITATLVAIGAALGVSTSDGRPNRIDSFEQIFFERQIEHGQLALLGRCPLEREIIVESTGKAQISWYVQTSAVYLPCGRAVDPTADQVSESQWDEPLIARIDLTLSQTQIDRLLEKLEGLSWKIEYTVIEEMVTTHSIGCSFDYIDHSNPARMLGIVKSDNELASLAADERYVPHTPSCIAKERANAAALDAAFASFAPLLPVKYELRSDVAIRLDRKD